MSNSETLAVKLFHPRGRSPGAQLGLVVYEVTADAAKTHLTIKSPVFSSMMRASPSPGGSEAAER